MYQPKPEFKRVYCSQCGEEFGPRDSGYSHCEDHKDEMTVDEADSWYGDMQTEQRIAERVGLS